VCYEVEPRAGLRLGDTELVLQTERPDLETDFLVDSAEEAARRVEELGGSVLSAPEDIPVGRVTVVADPFGNPLVLLDLSKGTFQTGPDGTVTGVG
jgi:Glyoxalase-like domain